MTDAGPLLLGLDAGNTVIKAVLYDLSGRQLAVSAMDGQSSSPAPGFVERDMEELWRNAATVIRRCLQEAEVTPESIAAVGCAGHGNGLYLLDRSGRPALAVQSLDGRAAELAAELGAGESGERLHALALQKPWPSQSATLLAWVKRHRPELYAETGTVLFCKDFVTYRLTGRRVSEISDMSAAGLLKLPEAVYDEALLEGYGLAEAMALLPELVQPQEVVGSITPEAAEQTGLAAGTPVVGGLFDVVASALGSGAVAEGQASIIAGTWSINQVIMRQAVRDPKLFMVSTFGPERMVAIEASATSAANLEWYVRELVERGGHHDDPFGHCNARIGEIEPAADDPIFHPYLYGSGRSAAARGGFYGLAGWHGEGHLLRALYEGVVFEHRRHIEVLRAAGLAFDRAVMSGGGTRSPHWPQMMADGLATEITVSESNETGALGAAIAAGVGSGLFARLEDGVASMTRERQVYSPDGRLRGHYDHRYRTYLDLVEAMTPFWDSWGSEAGENSL